MNNKPTLKQAREYGIEILEYEEVSSEDHATKEVKDYIKRENERKNNGKHTIQHRTI